MLNPRRHRTVTKSFEELTFKEQNQAMNRNFIQFRKQLQAHVQKAKTEGRCTKEVLKTRVRLLDRILGHYAEEIKKPAISVSD
jgi:leucyl-tRNA synthetase